MMLVSNPLSVDKFKRFGYRKIGHFITDRDSTMKRVADKVFDQGLVEMVVLKRPILETREIQNAYQEMISLAAQRMGDFGETWTGAHTLLGPDHFFFPDSEMAVLFALLAQ